MKSGKLYCAQGNVIRERDALIEYLFGCSDRSLGHFEIAHLNLAANFRKDFITFLDMLVEELAEARAARMIRELRAGQDSDAGLVFLALAMLLWQHEARLSSAKMSHC